MRYVECHKCGLNYPITQVRARTVEVESGRSSGAMAYKGWGSSGSWTGSTKKYNKTGGGLAYYGGRTYYRNVKVYVCGPCLAAEARARARARAASAKRWRIFWSIIFVGGVVLWLM